MTLKIDVDWQRDGHGTFPIDDVTGLVQRAQGTVSLAYGRDQSTALAPTVAGRGSFVLDNRDRRFSPRNTSSPIYGLVKPSRPVRVIRTIDGTDYTLFVGHTDDNPINPDPQSKTVTLSLVDSLADFRGQTISTPVYQGIRTGQAIGYILDACGWSPTLRDLDVGATAIPFWWEDNTDALTALEKIVRSEGPPALLTIGADGSIVFKDRHHRLLDASSLTSQSTWRDMPGAGMLTMQRGFVYDEAWRNIINTGTVNVDVRRPQQLQSVWESDTTITLTTGEQRVITVATSDPFINAVTPVQDIDYTLAFGLITVSLTRTSGGSTSIVVTAVGGSANITFLQLRAQPISTAYTVQVSASDTASINDYGPRSFPDDLPWCNQYDAEAVLNTAVAHRATPNPIISVEFMIGRDEIKSAAILARDLSDRVTVVETETSLNNDFYLESFDHELTGEHDHTVKVGAEMAPVPISPMFRFDTTGQGFNDGKFGSGIDDPSNIFLFDGGSGHRFNEALLAT